MSGGTLYIYFVVLILTTVFFRSGYSLRCYECNVWKAGYGQLCDNPRIREDCNVCMKVKTEVLIGYYKSVPRTSTIESKVCDKSKGLRFGQECFDYASSDGSSLRCYCDTDLCNHTSRLSPALVPLTVIGSILAFWFLQ